MSWYRLPSGQPWYAQDGSKMAIRLLEAGATVLDPADVDTARAAWAAHTPVPAGHSADWITQEEIDAAYAKRVEPFSLTLNNDGSVATETVGGVTTTYTYNTDGTLHTATRAGVTITYAYDAAGNMTGAA